MNALAARLLRRQVAWAVVILTVVLTALGALYAAHVPQQDDLLAFLPQNNPEIEQFQAIADRFGGLDVALVGIEADDVFDPAFLRSLQQATHRLGEVSGVDRVLTLANMQDFVEDPVAGGVAIQDLVDHIPTTDAEQAALRARVLSRDHVRGVLVSPDGKAVMLYCFLAYGSQPRVVAQEIQAVVDQAFPGRSIYWGGAPFINTWIYRTTQSDLKRLVPWAIAAIVLIMLLSFRDPLAAGLGLFATGVGILLARGAMGLLGVPDNLVLSSMPVILFAVGSAYSIHVISHFYAHLGEGRSHEDALATTLERTGPTVLAAGGTTIVGLLSFVTMDIQPMRVFGVFTALGVFLTMLVAITFVPAVLILWRPRARRTGPGVVERWTGAAMAYVQRHRAALGAGIGAVALVAAGFAAQVDHRMDEAAFFSENSPPERATRFMAEHFGGSQFLQVLVKGDLSDPDVLREVQQVVDDLGAVPGVSNIQAIPSIVALVNKAMTGVQRIPDTRAQVGVLYGFLAGDPSVSQLIVPKRDQGLLMVKVSAEDVDALEQVQARVQHVLDTVPLRSFTEGDGDAAARWRREVVAARIGGVARAHGGDVADPEALVKRLAGDRPQADTHEVDAEVVQYLTSDECWVPLATDQPEAIAAAVTALGPDPGDDALREAALGALGPGADPSTADDLALVLQTPLADAWRLGRAHTLADALLGAGLVTPGEAPDAAREGIAAAIFDLDLSTGLVPAEGPDASTLSFTVSGQPVLYQAMSRSVQRNQVKSLVYALVLVWAILALLFGSIWAGLLASAPTLLTLLLVYGAMGAMGVRLDIGTSMIASLVIGAGVDYAVHLLAAWQAPEGATDPPRIAGAAEAARDTAGAVWTNAAMVSAGFFVLTLGRARPLQNIGGLVSAAMLVAACATFVVIPLLARRGRYGR